MPETSVVDQVIQRQDKDGMLRRALERIIQLYTDKSHFVYELLQNAEDAGATKIRFEQYEDRLVVLHDGHPFSLENLQGLCDIGKSDKIGSLNQIGEFGVGFKSVFGICETVYLYSHPSDGDIQNGYQRFSIKIKDFTNPISTDDKEFETDYTTMYVFPYCVGLSFSGFSDVDKLNEVLSGRLQNLGITTLLFMKNLKSIDYKIELPRLSTTGSYCLDSSAINDHCKLVSAIGETVKENEEGSREKKKNKKKGKEENKKEEEKISYLVFSRPVEGIQSDRTIDIAFALKIDNTGEYVFQASKFPYISVYFPTETESKLKFIVQGPFRTTPNRSSVPSDDKDNISLAEQTAVLLRDSILELRDLGKLNYYLLNILPLDQEVFSRASLFESLYSETVKLFTKERVFLCKDGSYTYADSVKLPRGSEFAKFFSEELLTELFNDGKEYHWLPYGLTETNRNYRGLYDFLTQTLHIEVIRPEYLRDAYNKNHAFLANRDDDWLVKLYNMYANVGNAFSKQKNGSNMLTAEFIKTSKGEFVAPYRKIESKDKSRDYYAEYEDATYLPNVFLPCPNMEEMEGISFVDEKIYKKCTHFFNEILSLERPNEYEFFIRDFKKRYDGGKEISKTQHFKDIKILLKFRNNNAYRDEVDDLIHRYIKLRCTRGKENVYTNPSEEKVFFSINSDDMSIEQYYLHLIECTYVDIDFYASGGIDREMLEELGVSEDVAKNFDQVDGVCDGYYRGRTPEWRTSDSFRWKLELDEMVEAVKYISAHPHSANSMAKSSFIFRFLQKYKNYLTGTVHISGSYPNINNTYSLIVRELRNEENNPPTIWNWNGKWLYTESKDLVSQKEISKEELNTELYGELIEDSDFYDILGFRKNKEERWMEAQEQYDQLDKETKDQYFEMELQSRYHISSRELEKRFNKERGVSKDSNQMETDYFEFPSANVKNWDTLRKHAAEVLVYADPVNYEYKVRKIRVSKPDSEIDSYLRSMYKIDGVHQYACQMCHKPVVRFEKCQIYTKMEKELDAMYLCLCPNCAAKYREMRADQYGLRDFLNRIARLKEVDINEQDPVKIDFLDESIWFTQTHIAEIKELTTLKKEADKYDNTAIEETAAKRESIDEQEEDKGSIGTDVYKEFEGKRIFHKTKGYGFVKKCDGDKMTIIFEEGENAGEEKKFSVKSCVSSGLIQIVKE